MKRERVLLPLDIRKCPLEIFPLVEGIARRPEVTVILLHVMHLNIVAQDNRLYREVELEARRHLERLAWHYLPLTTSIILHVRVGKPAEQILAEARVENVDLIIIPTYGPSFWSRLVSVWKPGACRLVSARTERMMRDAPCAVYAAPVKSRFNCEEAWGWPMTRKNREPGRSSEPSITHTPALEPN